MDDFVMDDRFSIRLGRSFVLSSMNFLNNL